MNEIMWSNIFNNIVVTKEKNDEVIKLLLSGIEIWKPIETAGFEDLYEISSTGRVRSLHQNPPLILKLVKSKCGYLRVHLKNKSLSKMVSVHRLVGVAFVVGFKEGLHINHKDFDKANNKVNNLEWVTPAENVRYTRKNGRHRCGRTNCKLTEDQVRQIIDLSQLFYQRDLEKMFGVQQSTISWILKGNGNWKSITKDLPIKRGRGGWNKRSSKYKGVTRFRNEPNKPIKWQVRITFNKKLRHVGLYNDEIEAAKAYDKKAKELLGEKAKLNFPDEKT